MKKVLIIGGIIFGAVAIIATTVAITRTFLSQASSIEPAPTVIKLPPPTNVATPPAAPKPVPKTAPPPVATLPATPKLPATPVVKNGWTYTGLGPVDVTLSFSADGKNLYADFASNSFSWVTSMDYSLVYENDLGLPRMIKGTIIPNNGVVPRKVIALGTCSGTTCTYDTAPHAFTFRLLTKSNGGLTTNLTTCVLDEVPVP